MKAVTGHCEESHAIARPFSVPGLFIITVGNLLRRFVIFLARAITTVMGFLGGVSL